VVLPGSLADDDQLPGIGKHGKRVHAPGLILAAVFLRVGQGDQMAQRPGNDIVFPFHIGIVLLSAAEHPGDVAADGRLFSNDKMFHVNFSVS